MSHLPEFDPVNNAIEARLAAWTPKAPAMGRDHVLFEAGRAAGRTDANRRARRLGLMALPLLLLPTFCALALHKQERERNGQLAVALAAAEAKLEQPIQVPEPIIVVTKRPVDTNDRAALDPSSYLAIRRELARTSGSPTDATNRPDGEDSPRGGSIETLRVRDLEHVLEL